MSDLTHRAWSEALEDGELLGQACGGCDATLGAPKAACPHCGSRELETIELPTSGTVYTETTINVPPIGIDQRGYQVAVVQLGDARVLGRLVDQDVGIGSRVGLAGFDEDDDGYVTPHFKAE
ncbi:Zn-ribbon domain-containing OB-fold protein [Natronomonas salsuginis]|uniref:DUF35 domain-containing protein n=1 Tax=Natronomonas salsuginis TaxID=2217661 RepID=A0A4V5ZP44_9EURY|nr:zinc ribbon domain-containing protein [Natronomonas salsuginis]TKR27613.1 hypothetical protein DM868_00515 [Natronomonas salsuginis]